MDFFGLPQQLSRFWEEPIVVRHRPKEAVGVEQEPHLGAVEVGEHVVGERGVEVFRDLDLVLEQTEDYCAPARFQA